MGIVKLVRATDKI